MRPLRTITCSSPATTSASNSAAAVPVCVSSAPTSPRITCTSTRIIRPSVNHRCDTVTPPIAAQLARSAKRQECAYEEAIALCARTRDDLCHAGAGPGAFHRRSGVAGLAHPDQAEPGRCLPGEYSPEEQAVPGRDETAGRDHGLQVVSQGEQT